MAEKQTSLDLSARKSMSLRRQSKSASIAEPHHDDGRKATNAVISWCRS